MLMEVLCCSLDDKKDMIPLYEFTYWVRVAFGFYWADSLFCSAS